MGVSLSCESRQTNIGECSTGIMSGHKSNAELCCVLRLERHLPNPHPHTTEHEFWFSMDCLSTALIVQPVVLGLGVGLTLIFFVISVRC